MKTFAAVIGTLTLAQWVFIGLLHGFLTVQKKRSPETLERLHNIPVVGGYFLPPKEDKKVDELNEEEAKRNVRLVEAREVFNLPPAFDMNELKSLTDDIRARKDQLATARADLDERETRIGDLEKEVERREKKVAEDQEKLEARSQEVSRKQSEVDRQSQFATEEKAVTEAAAYKKIAKVYAEIDPVKAAEFLMKDTGKADADGQAPSADDRARNAALLLTYMDADKSAKIIEAMDSVQAVKITEKMREIGMKK